MKRELGIAATALLLALALNATPAAAQAVRTFVSGHGADTGTCGVGSPCRTFAYAITQTNASGEIVVLDSAGYGIVTISKAISITNEQGGEAAITVTAGDGITIAAGAGDVINLTGITLTGGGGANGITFTSGARLNIKNCVARGFTANGVNLTPGASSNFNITDTVVSENGGSGIVVQPSGTSATNTAFFERVQAIGNFNGFGLFSLSATGSVQATATNSDASQNGFGFIAQTFSAQETLTFTVANSTAVFNANAGLYSSGGTATMFVAGSTVSGNAHGFVQGAPGVIKTFGNNNIVDTNNTGTLVKVSQQ